MAYSPQKVETDKTEKKYLIHGIEVDPTNLSFRYKVPVYKPSEKCQKITNDTWARFRELEQNRNQFYRWFGKKHDGTYRNLIQYLDMSRKRWNSDGVPRTNLDEWQASVFKPETRNKIISILAAVAQQAPRNNFRGVDKNGGDKLKSTVIKDIYDWSLLKEDGDEVSFYAIMDAAIDGTVVRYEGYDERIRITRDILPESDFSTNDIKFKEKTNLERKLVTMDVALEDFYPGNIRKRISRMEEQPDCVWRKVMRYNDFRAEFNGWEMSKYVLPGGNITDETYFAQFVSDTVRYELSQLVEVIRYYSAEADQFIILANGVWINPLGREVISPLPFNHKQIPFWGFVYEPFSSEFFYGKSISDKLKDEQDSINALYNMMIDQGFIAANPTMVSTAPDMIDDVQIVPGKINYIGGENNSYSQLQIAGPQTSLFNLIQLMTSSIQQSSVDNIQGGIASEAKTATAVREASAAAARSFSLFNMFILQGYRRHGVLRGANIQQFMTQPSTVTRILGEDADIEEAFTPFIVPDAQLSNGKVGTRVIEMVPDKDILFEKLQNREQEREQLETKGVEKVYILPEYIRDYQFDVVPVPYSTIKETPEVRKALELQFQQMANAMYPDMINRESLFEDFMDVFEKDIDRIKNPTPAAMPGQAGMGQNNIAQQITQQATGGQANLGINLNNLQ